MGWKKTLPKKWTDVSAWAWGLVVGTPGGFEQKADGGIVAKWTAGAVRA